MPNLEIRDMPITCDFCCHPGVPLWRYDIPAGTVLVATYNPKTGTTNATKAHGALGACDPCDLILNSKMTDLAPGRIAGRMVKLPAFSKHTEEQRARSMAVWQKQLKRWLPLLNNRRVNVQGSDPTETTAEV